MRWLKTARLPLMSLLVGIALSLQTPSVTHAQEPQETEPEPVHIYIGQELTRWELPPYVDQGNTMVPMRTLFEKLGFTVSWDPDNRAALAQKGDVSISLGIGKSTAAVNSVQYYLDAVPVIKNGSTFMPLRFVSEAAGAEVLWDQTTRSVTLQMNTDADQSIRHLIDHVTLSSSFLQKAIALTGGDGITQNGTDVKSIELNTQGDSAKVTFEAGFTVSKAVKSDHGVTISPAESVVYEFTGEVYKDSAGQWVLKSGIDSLTSELLDKKPFMESAS